MARERLTKTAETRQASCHARVPGTSVDPLTSSQCLGGILDGLEDGESEAASLEGIDVEILAMLDVVLGGDRS